MRPALPSSWTHTGLLLVSAYIEIVNVVSSRSLMRLQGYVDWIYRVLASANGEGWLTDLIYCGALNFDITITPSLHFTGVRRRETC